MPTRVSDPIRSSLLLPLLLLAAGCDGSTDQDSNGTGGVAGMGAAGSGGAGATGGSGGSGGSGVGGSGGGAGSCSATSECPPDSVCGFPVSEACEAKGKCFPAPGAVCGAYSPGCACDGTEITVVCTGLPEGFVEKPLLHAGQCSFACGPSLQCNSTSQYCAVASGGPCCGEPSYSCETIPSACSADHSCACIQKAVSAQACTEADGAVTVQFMYP